MLQKVRSLLSSFQKDEIGGVIKLYKKVHKYFPEVEISKYLVSYDPCDIASLGFLPKGNSTMKSPTLFVGDYFFVENSRVRKAILAHEIAHLIKVQKHGLAGYKIINRCSLVSGLLSEEPDMKTRQILKNKPCYSERVKKWYALRDLFAYNKAADRGFGPGLLKFLKKYYKRELYANVSGYELIGLRVLNLQNRLGFS